MQALLNIQLLGGVRLVWNNTPLTNFHSPRLQSLLTYLILHRELPQSRQHLAFLFFPDSAETQARTNLRNLLHLLHHALPVPEQFLDGDAQTVWWRADAPCTIDVSGFEAALAQAATAQDWQKTVDLYRGDLMPGCYDDWIVPERERLRQEYVEALERLVICHEQGKDFFAARKYAQQLLTYDPLREETYRHLMQLAALSGDRASVARYYNQCVNVLARELSVEPSAETQATYQTALQRTLETRAESKMPHAQTRRHNSPLQLTSLIGRTEDVCSVSDAVLKHRLVTLVGAGGVGKTRLALATAAELLAQFKDGAWLVDLAPLTDGAMLPQALATVLQVRETPGASLAELIANFLREKQLLLVLDNCEHLVEAALKFSQHLLRAAPGVHILATSRQALNIHGEFVWHTLPLAVPAAGATNTIGKLMQTPAAQLFVERATTAFAAFGLTDENTGAVSKICQRLDGIPLAIELAAARVSLLTAPEIAARLEDTFHLLARGKSTEQPHHQTMRAALDWSHETLSESERFLFRRLAVFVGGFTVEAAEVVCADEQVSKTEVLDLLANLIAKSLVTTFADDHKPRMRLLEPMRAYAHEKLAQANETRGLQARHLDYFRDLAEQVAPRLQTRDQKMWLARLDAEHSNLLAALEWSEADEDSQARGLALGAALVEYWIRRGMLMEGCDWLSTVLANTPIRKPPRAKALSGLGTLRYMQGHLEDAAACHTQALELYREWNEQPGVIISLSNLGVQTYRQNKYVEAEILFQKSLKLARQEGNLHGMQRALTCLGGCALNRGEIARAQELFEQALELARCGDDSREVIFDLLQLGEATRIAGEYAASARWYQEGLQLAEELDDKWGQVSALLWLGVVKRHQGELTQAALLGKQSLKTSIEIDSNSKLTDSLESLAALAQVQGNVRRAARLFGATDALRQAIQVPLENVDCADYEQSVTATRAQLDENTFAKAWAEGRAMSKEQAVAYALQDD